MLEKSKEKSKKEDKKPNKALNVILIILSVVSLLFPLKQCVRNDCVARADSEASVVYYYIDGYNFYFDPPNGNSLVHALFPSFLISFERCDLAGSSVNTLRSFVFLEGYSTVDSAKLTSKEVFIRDFQPDTDGVYDLSYSTRLSYYILQEDFAPVYGESRDSVINITFDFVPIDTTPSRFVVNESPISSNSVVVYGLSPSTGKEYILLTFSFYVTYNGLPATGGESFDSPMLPYYAPNVGYQDGFNYGYVEGYEDGLRTGLDENFSIFDSIFSAVDSFLDIELFDGFKISTLLYIGFGLLLVGFVIKVFLGG